MAPFGVLVLFIIEKTENSRNKGSVKTRGQHPHSLDCFLSDSGRKLFWAFCCHSTSQQLLKGMNRSLAFYQELVMEDGFIKAAYTFQTVFPPKREICR